MKALPPAIPHDNLEEFQDPENYDIEEAGNAAAAGRFYGELAARTGGPVLELACGTGLVAIPVARQGLAVTGVDLAAPMLEHARVKAAREGLAVRWVLADARRVDFGRRFRLVYLTGNAFQAFLTDADQQALLATVARHLEVGGLFAFETRNPGGHDLVDRPVEQPWFSYLGAAGEEVRVGGCQRYDASSRVMHWTTVRRWRDTHGAERRRRTRIACRFTTPAELDALLARAGFETLECLGDWQGAAPGGQSPSIIRVCRRRAPGAGS